MEISNKLVLDIYDSAQHCEVSDFNEYALNRFKKVVQFDSAVIVDFSFIQQQNFFIQAIHLHAAPVEKLVDRPKVMGNEALNKNEALSSRDFVLKKAFAQRGKSVIADITRGSLDSDILGYCRKYETFHSLTLVSGQALIETIPTVALWRAAKKNAYSEKDAFAANLFLPHILQAKEINRRLTTYSSSNAYGSSTVFATLEGCLHFVEPEAIRLLQLEWKQWAPPILPPPLIASLRRTREKVFVGVSICVRASVQGNMICLAIVARSDQQMELSHAEYRVAKLAAEGLQYKEIAKKLSVSPATVRNQLHSAYRKLGVSNKTALAGAIPS